MKAAELHFHNHWNHWKSLGHSLELGHFPAPKLERGPTSGLYKPDLAGCLSKDITGPIYKQNGLHRS